MNELFQGHRFQKKFGQNFITDKNLLTAICRDAGLTSSDTVLEIGAGAGTLTAALGESAGRVVAYEIDQTLEPLLAQNLSAFSNISVVYRDFLRETDAELQKLSPFFVVANLPYCVTTPVLLRLIEGKVPPKGITVMVQKEVAERLTAQPGSAAYGAITVAVARYGTARISRAVPRAMFYPQPNVDSAVVVITPEKRYFPKNEAFFVAVCRAAFAMRRKTLANNLQAIGVPKATSEAALVKMGFSATVRGETLSAEEFCTLSDMLK